MEAATEPLSQQTPAFETEADLALPYDRHWLGRARRTFRFGLGDTDAAIVALSGFLVRGGVVLLTLPSAMLPSLLGLAAVFGVNSFGIDGRPTAFLFSIVAVAVAAAALALAVGTLVGSAVDVWLIRAALEDDARAVRRPQPFPDLGLLLEMAAVRLACMFPLGIAIAVAASPLYDAVYGELTLPTNLTEPLLYRVVVRAALPLAAIALTWLACETVAGVAIRRLVMAGEGIWASLFGAVRQLVERPLTSFVTVAGTMVISVVGLALGMLATAFAFDSCLIAARLPNPVTLSISIGPLATNRDFRPLVFAAAALVLGAIWVAAMAIAGITSAWRSAAWTAETASACGRSRSPGPTRTPAPEASPTGTSPRHNAGL